MNATVAVVQPYAATKRYVCPGCDTMIEPGVGHLVVVPDDEPDLRRHWHRGCWFKEVRRTTAAGDLQTPGYQDR